jgi:hypothetical protein
MTKPWADARVFIMKHIPHAARHELIAISNDVFVHSRPMQLIAVGNEAIVHPQSQMH